MIKNKQHGPCAVISREIGHLTDRPHLASPRV
jgi:hypothetical protein